MKKRYSEEQIIGFLKEAEAGVSAKELLPSARVLRSEFLFLAQQIWRDGRVGCKATKGLGRRRTRALRSCWRRALLENEVTCEALRKKW